MSVQTDFIAKVKDGAISGMKSSGILASLSIAQSILESGWGRSRLATVGNALFGIKAGSGWNGKTLNCKTFEVYFGNRSDISALFRAYDSWAASIADHSAFLKSNGRYANLIGCIDYKIACQRVQADGYATSPVYAQSLIGIIEQYNLTQFDKVTATAPVAPPVTYYTVVRGDCLSTIASRYHTTYPKLAAANGISAPYVIHVGQKIKIA